MGHEEETGIKVEIEERSRNLNADVQAKIKHFLEATGILGLQLPKYDFDEDSIQYVCKQILFF